MRCNSRGGLAREPSDRVSRPEGSGYSASAKCRKRFENSDYPIGIERFIRTRKASAWAVNEPLTNRASGLAQPQWLGGCRMLLERTVEMTRCLVVDEDHQE